MELLFKVMFDRQQTIMKVKLGRKFLKHSRNMETWQWPLGGGGLTFR